MTETFETTDRNDENGMAILKITSGPYAGTEFSFGRVEFSIDEPGKLSFNYDVHSAVGVNEETEDFNNTLGAILVELIENHVNSGATDASDECSE